MKKWGEDGWTRWREEGRNDEGRLMTEGWGGGWRINDLHPTEVSSEMSTNISSTTTASSAKLPMLPRETHTDTSNSSHDKSRSHVTGPRHVDQTVFTGLFNGAAPLAVLLNPFTLRTREVIGYNRSHPDDKQRPGSHSTVLLFQDLLGGVGGTLPW